MTKKDQLKKLRDKIKNENFSSNHPVRMDLFFLLLGIVEEIIEELTDDGR